MNLKENRPRAGLKFVGAFTSDFFLTSGTLLLPTRKLLNTTLVDSLVHRRRPPDDLAT